MNDFADWLSPIVVKELRQGMRSRAFVSIFLLLQTFMIFCVLSALGDESRNGASAFFWAVIGITLLLGIPARGTFSVASEIKGNTMELLLLTQLSAWRIIAGKWAALFLQSLLLACSVLPYVVLRYFYGGVDLASELMTLGSILAINALLTALAVGISPYQRSAIGRIFIALGSVAMIQIVPAVLVGAGIMGRSSTLFSSPGYLMLLAVALIAPILLLEFLEFGIAGVAPMGENHSTRKRLLALTGVAAAAALAAFSGHREFFATLAALQAAPICLIALMEKNHPIPSLYGPVWPFPRPSRIARFAGKFLYPGWTSAIPFSLLIIVAVVAISPFRFDTLQGNFYLCCLLGSVFLPLALLRVINLKKAVFPFFIAFQGFCFVLAAVLAGTLPDQTNFSPSMLLPTTGFLVSLWRSGDFRTVLPESIVLGLLMVLISLATLLVFSVREWRAIAELERKAGAME